MLCSQLGVDYEHLSSLERPFSIFSLHDLQCLDMKKDSALFMLLYTHFLVSLFSLGVSVAHSRLWELLIIAYESQEVTFFSVFTYFSHWTIAEVYSSEEIENSVAQISQSWPQLE